MEDAGDQRAGLFAKFVIHEVASAWKVCQRPLKYSRVAGTRPPRIRPTRRQAADSRFIPAANSWTMLLLSAGPGPTASSPFARRPSH